MKKVIVLLVVITISSTAVIVGYYKKGYKANLNKPTFAFIINVPGRFWDIAYAGCQKAAREENVNIDFQVPGQSSAAQQKQIVESLIAKGVNGLAISPLNPESISRLLDEAAEYMPVICQDSDAPNSKRVCYIGTDNVDAGRQAAEQLKKALPNGGEIAVFVGKLDVANARERYQGVADAMKDSNCKIVEVFTDQADRTRAQLNVRAALAKYPNLKGIVGLWGYNAPAAVMALKDAPAYDVKIVSFDEDIETLEAIRRGQIFCSIVQNPYEFGYQSIKLLAKLHRKESVEIPKSKMIFIPVRVVSSKNVDEIEKSIDFNLSMLDKKIKNY